MKGDYIIARLRNERLNVRAQGGKVVIWPKERLDRNPELRELVRKHKAEVLQALAKWPNSHAPARNPLAEPPRPDERQRVTRPVVINGRHPWRRPATIALSTKRNTERRAP